MLKRQRHGDVTDSSLRVVPLSCVIVAVVLAALLSGAAVAAVDRLALDAPAGPQGPEGPPGPAGDAAALDADVAWEQIEADPERLSELLDPTPSDLADRDEELAREIEQLSSEANQVADNLSSLCRDLSFADALSSEVLSCP